MSKKLVAGILGGVLLATVVGVYLFVGSLDEPTNRIESTDNTIGASNGVTDVEQKSTSTAQGNQNPFEENVKTPLKEDYVQQYIHAMSHQKVEAAEKWSFFKITDERIDFLLGQLDVNKYKNEDIYRDILLSWKDGDFSNAASQHNRIWRMQEGTVGKASGLLSPKEEKVFLQEQNRESR
ncbi:hypothetical protein I7V34_14915 [Bacillus sp. V3]|nr:hypothetical protein I7V34_14915 [Bacillus sp. V3]